MEHSATNPELTISITPGTVYVSANPSQSSYANLVVTIQNRGTGALSVKNIAITLPTELAPLSGLKSISTAAAQPNLWHFNASQFAAGEFDASPASGDSWSFSLKNVTLATDISKSPAVVMASVNFSDGSAFPQKLPVNLAVATASVVFTANLPNITPGQMTTLSWQCKGIDYCIILPGDGSHLAAQGTQNETPQSTTIYTLFAYGDGVILSAQFGITVSNPQILSFGPAPGQARVDLGSNVTLNWRCNEYTDSIQIVASTSITIPPAGPPKQGSVPVGPVMAPTTFTLYAYAADKTVYTTEIAEVGINDVTATLTATPSTGLWAQDEVTLSWDITNASEVTFTPELAGGPSLQNLSGSVTYSPPATVTSLPCKLTVKGFVDNLKKAISNNPPIVLNFQPVTIDTFSISPGIIRAVSDPNQATLAWSTHAQNVSIDKIGGVDAVGSQVINAPANGTVYTLSAGTNRHPATTSKQVQVLNGRGPFTFNNFFDVENPHQSYSGFPVAALAGLSNYINLPCVITVTGVMMGGVPLTRISARILNSQGHGLSFTFSAAGELRWADPNNPSGIINVVG
jgi:hypothetical protein